MLVLGNNLETPPQKEKNRLSQTPPRSNRLFNKWLFYVTRVFVCIKVSVTRTFTRAGYQQSFKIFFAQLKLFSPCNFGSDNGWK